MSSMAEDIVALGFTDPKDPTAREANWNFLCNNIYSKETLEAHRAIFKQKEEEFLGKRVCRVYERHICGRVIYIPPETPQSRIPQELTF